MPKNPLRSDPSRTATLRMAFQREMAKRFNALRKRVKEAILSKDVLGIRPKDKLVLHGGVGSGNFGHAGRPGEVGGSGGGGGGGESNSKEFPTIKQGAKVDGREVLDEIPNQDSISASLNEYKILPGIREVPTSSFDPIYKPKPYSVQEKERLDKLVKSIEQSKTISPLIVVIDSQGPYILEGGHRFDALLTMKAKSFPALVVIDTESAGNDASKWKWKYTKETINNILNTNATPIPDKAYAFQTADEKLKSFNKWFKEQVDQGILEGGQPWTSKYVDSAYRKGVVRSYTDAHKKDLQSKSADFFMGSKEEFLRMAFSQPERMSKLKLLFTRTYEELRGVTSAMSQSISRTLASGIAQGIGPGELARKLDNAITGIGRTRAETIARTEIIHAHAEGQLDSFEDMGMTEAELQAEWSTAGDEKVCDLCEPLDGKILPIEEARGLIPRHPNCRCTWIPATEAVIEEKEKAGDTMEPSDAETIPEEEAPPPPEEEEVEEETGTKFNTQEDVDKYLDDFVKQQDFFEKRNDGLVIEVNRIEKEYTTARNVWVNNQTEENEKKMKELEEAYTKAFREFDANTNSMLDRDKLFLEGIKETSNKVDEFDPPNYVNASGNQEETAEKAFKEVLECIPKNIKFDPSFPVLYFKKEDGLNGSFNHDLLLMKISPELYGSDLRKTAIHEYGHRIQSAFNNYQKEKNYTTPLLQNKETAFFDSRTKGETVGKLEGYESEHPKIRGKNDKWKKMTGDSYAGRVYWNIEKQEEVPREVFSVGLELLFSDPTHFVRTDREWASFVLSALKGIF